MNDRKRPDPGFASPPCMLHEVDPVYLGYMSAEEMVAFLNELLEAERAGASGVGEMAAPPGAAHRPLLQAVAADEARFCAMLTRHIARLQGRPTAATGKFLDKLRATDGLEAKLNLLNRGQGWVVKKLREGLQKIDDPMLYADLREMLEAHEANIAACEQALVR
ncbi:MAG: DUF6306 domain-containing protein [Reyranellaceae bacterium]